MFTFIYFSTEIWSFRAAPLAIPGDGIERHVMIFSDVEFVILYHALVGESKPLFFTARWS